MKADVIIVGGGISGLAAAAALQHGGHDWLLLEAENELGGRIRTDHLEGAQLDRGFQVLQTSYPALHRSVDLDQLELASFQLGARIMTAGSMSAFYDPQRLPGRALTSLGQSPANLGDYTALVRLALANAGGDSLSLDEPSLEMLPRLGFSERFIGDFLVPFFRAVFLDPALEIPWRHMRELILMFSQGLATLPARGMQALPELMASGLEHERILTERRVEALAPGSLRLRDGGEAACHITILATNATQAGRLLGWPEALPMRGVRSYHFAAEELPTREPILYLPGSAERGPLSSFVIPSNLQKSYAFGERAQVLASTLEMDATPALQTGSLRAQLASWFGGLVDNWELLHVNDVPQALPVPSAMGSLPSNDELIRERQLLLCGDYPGTPSINRALASGRSAGNLAAMHLRIGKL